MKLHLRTIFFLFICLGATPLFGQGEEMVFEHLSIRQGLSQSIVTGITQDKKGFMWFATEDGLNKYDAYEFSIYKNDPNKAKTLPDNWITSVVTDKDGTLWVGTIRNGIASYDKFRDEFVAYPPNPKNPKALSDDYVTTLYADRAGTIWVGTDNSGLCRFDKATKTFKTFRHNPGDPSSVASDFIRVIYEDKKGNLWIGTNQSLSRFDSQKQTFVNYLQGDAGLNSSEIRAICEDDRGILWIGTGSGGINKFDPVSGRFYNFSEDKVNNQLIGEGVGINAILQDSKGVLWIGTMLGGVKRELKEQVIKGKKVITEEFTRFRNLPSNPNSLTNNNIRCIYEDISGVIWFGTDGGGVNFYDSDTKRFKHYKHDANDANSLANNIIRSVYEDSEGILWVGAIEGSLDRFDRKKGEVRNFRNGSKSGSKISGTTVSAIYEDRSGYLWFGTWGGGLNRFDRRTEEFVVFMNDPNNPQSISHNQIQAIREDQNGYLWIATDNGLNRMDRKNRTFKRYMHDPENPASLSNNSIQSNAFIIDKYGVLWMGTYGGGLDKYDPEVRRFTHYKNNPKDPQSLSDNRVISLYEDRDGNIWVGTHGGGMCKFERKTEKFTRFTTKEGLANDEVYGILADDKDNIWASTKNGLTKLSIRSLTFRNYHETDGLQSNVFYWGAAFKSKSGELFFGGTNGLNAFFPDDIKDNTYKPPVVLTKIEVLNHLVPIQGDSVNRDSPLLKHINETSEIVLSYKQNSFAFEFAALNYRLSQKNKYEFKLENYDSDWVPAESRKRFAAYSNLPFGSYTFKVRAANNDGVWNSEGVSIRIRIEPPVWRTLWFQSTFVFLVFGSIYMAYKARVSRIERQKQELKRQVEEITSEMMIKNEELELQKKEITLQRDNIQSSIKYAQRIQEAMLPLPEEMADALPASFVLFKPRDMVSGDFYWLSHSPQKTIVAAVDCTGHGVPGAFMSMIGNDLLNEIVYLKEITEPDIILNELHKGVRKSLRQKETQNRDGMDVAICTINRIERTLEFAGAENPLFYIQDDQFFEIKGTKAPIGGKQNEAERLFKKHILLLDKPGIYYIFSDGYQDQFGGPNNSKFMVKRFKELLMTIYKKPMHEQKEILEHTIADWIGTNRQIDDILVIGFKI